MMDTNLPFEPVKLNAGSDPTKAKEMPDAGTSKEEEQPVLGKRARDAKNEPSTDGKKKTKVEESADSKADRRRILEEKKRMLADIEKELAKISRKAPSLSSSTPGLKQSASAPTTPMLSASTPLPAPRGVPSGRGRGRGAARGAAAATPAPVVPVAIEPEGEPATTTAVFADPPAPPARGKRKSSAGIPRRASHDVSTLPTSPTPEGPVTRAKRARRPKRLDAFGGPVQLTWALKQCQVLLKTLMTHRFGWPFNQPVDPIALNIPDYFDVIKNPMDLGTIKEQLDSGSYEHEDEFATDVRLVFSNTFTYNQPGSDIVLMASTLSGIFEEKFKALKAKVGDHVESGEAVEQSMRELRESVSTIQRDLERFKKTSNGRGRAEDQRPMTFDEKKKLSQAINTLPSEHLGMVVKIIHERMPQLTASGEEIEIDIDALNPATLRHLERFVRSVTQRTAGRSRRGSRTPSLSGSSKSVQTESLVPQGTQQKIEDVERQIKALTEHQQALTQKGLARSTGEGDLLLAAAEKKRNDESETSESETDGSDSESSDSESSDSESDSGSDSESTDSESEKRDNTATAVVTSTQPATASLATTVTAPINVGSVPSDLTAGESSSEVPAAADVTSGSVAGEVAASAPSPATTPMSSGVEDEKSAAHHNQENGKAISFSFDPKDSILPAEAGNGDESLTQAAVAMDDAPPKSEAPKQVALKNVDAWSELSDDFETPATAVKPQSPPSLDKTWSQFQTKKMQDAIREKERLEKEERERKERERREEERRLEEERRRREQEEAEERRRRELEEAELAAQRERERQRQAERLARERGDMSVMEQSLLMASFEQQAAPALPIFQYKSLDDVSEFGDLDDDDAPPAANDHASSNGSHPAALDDDAPHPLFDGEEEEPEPEPPRVVNPETSSFGAGEEAVAGPVEDAMDQEEAPAP